MSIYLGTRSTLKNIKSIINVSDFLKKDGSIAMAGNFDLGNYAIDNLKSYPENNKNATSKKYVDDETKKLLDLAATRPLTGDLNLNDNAIIGIYDINVSNSVPSKKFVRDELAKKETKIAANKSNINSITTDISVNSGDISRVKTDIVLLKSKPIYSHYFHFAYQNPVASFAKNPSFTPSGFPDIPYIFSLDYNEKTRITLLCLMIDSDTTVNSNSATLSVDGKFYDNTGGSAYKTILSSTNIGKYRKNSNIFRFNDLSFVIKDLDSANFDDWNGFILPITVSWTNNETRLIFSVDYY